MNKKQFLSLILCLSFVFGFMPSRAEANFTSEDPIITKSYADGAFYQGVLSSSISSIETSFKYLNYKLDQLKNQTANQNKIITAMPNEIISLSSGSSFMLFSGSATINKLSGAIINLTSSESLNNSSNIAINQNYVIGEGANAEILITTGAKVLLKGSASLSSAVNISFTDVKEDNWFYKYVNYAVSRGLINGRNDEIFDPEVGLSIAEALKLAACMHQLYHEGSVSLKNDEALWYKSYLEYCIENDIISATYGDYDARISRDEFVSIFYAALPVEEYVEINSVSDNGIPDVKIGDNHSKEIYAFYRAGILIGKDGGYFMPEAEIWRSEVAAIITRMFEKTYRQNITL